MTPPRCSRCDERAIGYYRVPYIQHPSRWDRMNGRTKSYTNTKQWHVCFEDMKRLAGRYEEFVPYVNGRRFLESTVLPDSPESTGFPGSPERSV